jgi:DNA-binding CsgD family transcriptional regulator
MALAGLVSAEAEDVYRRLRVTGTLRAGALRAGAVDGELDPAAPGVAELLELGVAFRSGSDGQMIKSIDPAAALRLLIEARQDEMVSFQSRILEGWARLTRMVPLSVDAGAGATDGIRVLTRVEDIVARTAELYSSPKQHLRGTETGIFPTRMLNSVPATARARVRMIYDADYQRTGSGAAVVERSLAAGEGVRLRNALPIKMLHVDDYVALLSADRTGQNAILIHAKPIVDMLADWFDMLWDHPTTMRYPVGGAESHLNVAQRDVLKLMLACDDETIARRLELSVTTVRRHIKTIYRALGVNNRFAAGLAAAKLAWL